MPILIGDHRDLAHAAGAMFFCGLHLLQSVPAFLRKKIFLVHQVDPICLCERFGTRAIKHDVRRFFHDQTRQTYGIFDVFDATNCTGSDCLSIHDRCVHFICASAGENRTAPGIEVGIVFEHANRRLRRVET